MGSYSTNNFCECASPWISGDKCDQCNKVIAAERLKLLPQEQTDGESTKKLLEQVNPNIQFDEGVQAALRVKKYGTLWDQVGSIINTLNSIGTVILVIVLLVSGLEGKIILLGVIVIALLWGLSYLQISIMKGLGSYFQMRSAEYLERMTKK